RYRRRQQACNDAASVCEFAPIQRATEEAIHCDWWPATCMEIQPDTLHDGVRSLLIFPHTHVIACLGPRALKQPKAARYLGRRLTKSHHVKRVTSIKLSHLFDCPKTME